MKNCKLLSVLIAVIMLISSSSLSAFAIQPKSFVIHNPGDRTGIYLLNNEIRKNAASVTQKFTNASSYRFYDQLNATEKIIYNGIVNQKAGINTSNGNFSVNITNGDRFDENVDKMQESYLRVLAAIIDDVPELYWLLEEPYEVEVKEITVGGKLKIDFTFVAVGSHVNSFAQLKKEYNDTVSAAKNFPVEGVTRYEKVKSIADGICDMASYAEVIYEGETLYFYPSGCLLAPHETVCDGYSKAFKMICDFNNIPSIIVVGKAYTYDYDGNFTEGDHAWNYVQMDDGKWYAVDTTWMDDNPIESEFFLVGANTEDSFLDSFSKTHIADGCRFYLEDTHTGEIELISFNYPRLNEGAYVPKSVIKTLLYGDVNGDQKVTISDAKLVLMHIVGRSFTENQKKLADVNKSNNISITDAKWILQNVAKLRELGTVTQTVLQ